MASYNDFLIAGILSQKNFPITQVNEVEEIDCMLFHKEQYPAICAFIKDKNWQALKTLIFPAEELTQYLSIHRFTDQSQNHYAVTSLDSDELWEDPVVMDIFPL